LGSNVVRFVMDLVVAEHGNGQYYHPLFLLSRTGSNRLSSLSVLASTGNFSREALDLKIIMPYTAI